MTGLYLIRDDIPVQNGFNGSNHPLVNLTTMNLTENHPNTHTGAQPFSVIHAEEEIMLTLLDRPGRFPIEVTVVQSLLVGWRCSDGAEEFIAFEGDEAASDFERIKADLDGEGLLVGEISDPSAPNLTHAKHWLVQRMHAHRAQEGQRA